MRVAVYTDQPYSQQGGATFTSQPFAVFLAQLAESFERLVVVGRLDPEPGRSHYELPDTLDFAPLPHYADASRPLLVVRALAGSMRRFWKLLDDVDAVWLLGPYPLSIAFAILATLRRKRVTLGVRQDTPQYIRKRHPGRRLIYLGALGLEHAYRLLARRYPVIVVGPDLARNYRAAVNLLEISMSLVRERDILAPGSFDRSYEGELRVLSVGRLDSEKNPLLLADVLARLHESDQRWRLTVCGDGPLRQALARRLRALGLSEFAELKGHVPIDDGLMDVYRQSHFFLHVSWTEGLPQVLLEAFASRLPLVATAVGGVEEATSDAALLVQPNDPNAAADLLITLAEDPDLRARLIESGIDRVRTRTIEAEAVQVAQFLRT